MRVVVVSDNPDRFVPGSIIHARARGEAAGEHGERQPLEILRIRGEAGFLIVAFRGVEDRPAAEALRGAVLEVPGVVLPSLPDDEFYLFELKGLEVRVEGGRAAGVVSRVLEYPSQEVLEVETPEGPTFLVPFTHEAVPVVDVGAGFVVVAAEYLGSR